jgi:LysR family transcriptional activator of glutamate synthase operon
MELRQLRYFAAVARHRHFTRASEELHVAQPGLSQQVRRLEQELGVELFSRTTRQVTLTQAGELLLPRAQDVLAGVDAARAEIDELMGLARGRVAVGTLPVPALDIPGLLADFRRRHPAVEIQLREELWAPMRELLRAARLDFAFALTDPGEVGPDLEAELLFDEELVAVLPPGDELARRKRVRLAELADRPLITFNEGSAVRKATERAFARAGQSPRIAVESLVPESVRSLAARGIGIALLPRSYAESDGPPVAVRSLAARQSTIPVSLVWRAGHRQSPAAATLLALARERFSTQSVQSRAPSAPSPLL